MPNWSDDEGRCHYSVNGVPCYQSPVGCPMHGSEKPKPKRKSKVKLSAYERCLNALNMTEPDQRVEVDAEVLARLLKQHEALRAEVERLREALRDVAERQREACAEFMERERWFTSTGCRAAPLVTEEP